MNHFINILIRYFLNAHPAIVKCVEVLIEFQTYMYLKINLVRTTIKQTKNKAVVKKHQDIKKLRYIDITTS